jgi:Tol biopolymer transport system component
MAPPFVFARTGAAITVLLLALAAVSALAQSDPGYQVAAESVTDFAISGDGRYIAYANGTIQLFDGVTGNTTSVDYPPDTQFVTGVSSHPSISSDGSLIVFQSTDPYLVSPSDSASRRNIYLRNRQTGTLQRVVSVPEPYEAWSPTITPDGRYILFATNYSYVPQDQNGVADVYVYDRQANTYSCASIGIGGGRGEGGRTPTLPSTPLDISADGSTVLFTSQADTLVGNDTNGVADLFVCVFGSGGGVERVSVDASGVEANGSSFEGTLSANGRYVAFLSNATNLVPITNGVESAFLRDRTTGTVTSIDQSVYPAPINPRLAVPVVSADGRYVLYTSRAGMLNAEPEFNLVRWDRQTNQRTTLNVQPDGTRYNITAEKIALSLSGAVAGFEFLAQNIGGSFFLSENYAAARLDLASGAAGEVSVAPLEGTVAEGSGSVSFLLSRGSGYRAGVGVNYSFGGTAVAGADHTGSPGRIVFGFAETQKIVTVGLLNDAAPEAIKTLIMNIDSVDGGGTVGASPAATVYLVDDDSSPSVTLAESEMLVGESDGVVRVVIRRSGALSQALTVNVSTSNGTAASGSDFVGLNRSITFAPGVVEQTVNEEILDDLTVEGAETFSVLLSAPAGVTVGTGQTLVTILDGQPSIIDQFGHELEILDAAIVPLGLNASYSRDLTVLNPSPGRSNVGDVQFVRKEVKVDGSGTGATVQLPTVALPALDAGTTYFVTTNGGPVPDPPSGYDYIFYAVVRENVGGTMLIQAVVPFAARYNPNRGGASGRRGATGGVTLASSTAGATSFRALPPPTLSSITISGGRSSLYATESTKFTVSGTLSDGSSSGALAADWSATVFPISATGQLNTNLISATATVTVKAKTTLNGVTRSAARVVTVNPLPAPTFTAAIPPSRYIRLNANSTYDFRATPLVTRYEVSAGQLPTGLVLHANGLVDGPATQLGDFQATIAAANAAGQSTVTVEFRVRKPIEDGTGGRYIGISMDQTAALDLTTTAAGGFTGTFRSRDGVTQLRGGFVASSFEGNVGPLKRLHLQTHLYGPDVSEILPRLEATVEVRSSGVRYDFVARRVSAQPPRTGAFTYSCAAPASGLPLGLGCGAFSITSAGAARIHGFTADGQTFTFGTGYTEDLRVPLFGQAGRSVVAVLIDVAADSGALSGSLRMRRASGGSGPFGGGFDEFVQLSGAPYTAPPPNGSYVFSMGNGSVSGPSLAFNGGRQITRQSGYKLNFSAATGLGTGTTFYNNARRSVVAVWREDLGVALGRHAAGGGGFAVFGLNPE